MPELHITTTLNVLVLILAGAASIFLSVFAYRYTVPPVSRFLKACLISLRASGIFLLLFLLGEPLLSLLYRNVDPPTVLVAIDNSKSMAMTDRLGKRKEILRSIVESPPLERLAKHGAIRYAFFDTRWHVPLLFHPDSLRLDGEGTDLGMALRHAKEEAAARNIRAVVLISDGNATIGSSPLARAEEVDIPIFTVGIGDTSEQQDVLVRKVTTNSITYVGNRLPVNVTLKSSGYAGERLEVTLRGSEGILDRRMLTLQAGIREYAVPLSVVPVREGRQRLVVEVSRLPGEVSYENNRSVFFTRVLKSKLKIALIAGAPSPDVAFLRRALEEDENLEVLAFIARDRQSFYERPPTREYLSDVDCLVLVGYPTANVPQASFPAVLAAAEEKGLLFVGGRQLDPERLRLLEPFLPVQMQQIRTDEQQVFVALVEARRSHPILKTEAPLEAWTQLPPLFVGTRFRAKAESEILAYARVQSVTLPEPLIVMRHIHRKKSIAIAGYGLWRWRMLSPSLPGGDQLLGDFLSNSVRWLTTREDDRPIRVETTKELFDGREPIEFIGQVYDETYQPVEDAEIDLTITSNSTSMQIALTLLGNGQYEGRIESLPQGEYSYTARVHAEGRPLGEERGTFSVGGFSVEFQETKMNKLLLQQLAHRTGGKYFDPTDIESMPDEIAALPSFQPREVVQRSEVELWNREAMLALVLLIFALEWFLRKRNGML
jgi:hypothetical protein